MFLENFARNAMIIQKQLKLIIIFGIGLAAIFLAVSPAIMGLKYLDAGASAVVLERYVSLIGVILLTPLFFPEQNKDIAELVEAKYTSHMTIIFLRLIASLVVLFIMILIMILIMKNGGCDFPFGKYLAGTFITAFVLGALGFAGSGISGNLIAGYLLAMCCYILNFGLGKKLGNFYLFTMSRSFTEKYYLLAAAVVLIGLTFLVTYIRFKKR